MPTIYTKTSLKKVKKDELVDMFYEQQYKLYKIEKENKSELGINYKELYEAQQKETDIEHQRYLETAEKYSNKLWEICQELDIENDDTSQNIIQAIKKLQEENKKLKQRVADYKNFGLYFWSHGNLGDQNCLCYPVEVWNECLNATDEDNCDTEALTKKCMEAQE